MCEHACSHTQNLQQKIKILMTVLESTEETFRSGLSLHRSHVNCNILVICVHHVEKKIGNMFSIVCVFFGRTFCTHTHCMFCSFLEQTLAVFQLSLWFCLQPSSARHINKLNVMC